MSEMDRNRWHVEFRYAGGNQVPPVDIEEISDLQEIIEYGPDWGTLIDVVITYNFHKSAEERGQNARLS